MSVDFESAKAFLKKAGDNGQSLYDHLTDVLVKITSDKPENALQAFESLSVQIKNAHLQPPQYREIPPLPQDGEHKKKLLQSLHNTIEMLKPTPNEEDEADVDDDVVIPDLLAEAEVLGEAGVQLDREQMYKLQLSIHQLARKEQLSHVRFWGQIFGTQQDYFIVEAKMKEINEEEEADVDDPRYEPLGTGANTYVYYVCNSPESKWTRLPPVLPQQIILARQMRRFFTGHLSSSIFGFPRFPWSEASFLRATIQRISASSLLCPRGYYVVDEEDKNDDDGGGNSVLMEADEYEIMNEEEMKNPENWVHCRHHLLRQGRQSKYIEKNDDDDEEEEDEEERRKREERNEEDEEEMIAILSSIEQDQIIIKQKQNNSKPLPVWTFRSSSLPSSSSSSSSSHAVSSAHSLLWPGAVNVMKKKTLFFCYVGYGQKQLYETYTPPSPSPMQREYVYVKKNDDDDGVDEMKEQDDPLPPPDLPDRDDDDEGDEEEDEEDEDGEEHDDE